MNIFAFPFNLYFLLLFIIVAAVTYFFLRLLNTNNSESTHTIAKYLKERERFKNVFQSMGVGVLQLNNEGKIIYVNRFAALMFDTSEVMVSGKMLEEVATIEEKGQHISSKFILSKMHESKNETEIFPDLRMITQVGKEKFIYVTVSVMKKDNHVQKDVIVILHDISTERDLEKIKLDFVSMAAHELRTPLTSLRGYLTILHDELQKDLSKDHQLFLERSIISSNQLYSLVQNLLNVSRMEQGRFKLETKTTSMGKIAEGVLESLKQTAIQNKVELTYNKPEQELPTLEADELRISEVLTNLVANAINYNRPGGWVKIDLQQKEDKIIVSVSDSGQGIPASSIPHLFTKFYRVTSTIDMGAKGTGFGLFISKSVVEAHHGEIWVESTLGKGSTFHFALPLKQPKVTEKIGPKPQGLYDVERYGMKQMTTTKDMSN